MEDEEIGGDDSVIVSAAMVLSIDLLRWPELKEAAKRLGARIHYQVVRSQDVRLRVVEARKDGRD